MTHYTVLCVTKTGTREELEELLAPYNENLDVPGGNGNPLAKWDWWTVGGRWDSGAFLTRGGLYVNGCWLDDLDLDGMRVQAEADARDEWARMDALVGHLPATGRSWADLEAELSPSTGDEWQAMRTLFWNQPRPAAIRKTSWTDNDLCLFERGLDVMVEKARLSVPGGWAICHPGGWEAPGEMGWWAASTATFESTMMFARTKAAMLAGLPGDTWLTMVDCHR